MRKIIRNIILIIIVVLTCFYLYKGALERFAISGNDVDYSEYENRFYYNQLSDEQKKIYIYSDQAIDSLETKIKLGITKNDNIAKDIERAIDAIYNDMPEYYFLPKAYNVKTIEFGLAKYIYIEMNYDVKNMADRNKKDREIEWAIQQLLNKCITPGMSDIQKETAIHDALLKEVEYYDYYNIESIPNQKHTSYGALVEKEAVCDGISKAMMILLNRVGIESTIVFGNAGEVAHAWNIVKLDNEYYHLDATSNAINLNSKRYVMHNYFNITTQDILYTHSISNDFKLPECESLKYNYYIYNEYEVDYTESMRSKLAKIVNKQASSPILEVKIDSLYSTQQLLDALYFLDFNDWSTDRITTVAYHNNRNVYIFENDKGSN